MLSASLNKTFLSLPLVHDNCMLILLLLTIVISSNYIGLIITELGEDMIGERFSSVVKITFIILTVESVPDQLMCWQSVML